MTMSNETREVLQNMFDATVSIYEAALAGGVDEVTFNRLDTMMDYAYELAVDVDIDTGTYDDLTEMIARDSDGNYTFSDEYNEDEAWESVDASLDGDDDGTDVSDSGGAAFVSDDVSAGLTTSATAP